MRYLPSKYGIQSNLAIFVAYYIKQVDYYFCLTLFLFLLILLQMVYYKGLSLKLNEKLNTYMNLIVTKNSFNNLFFTY